MKKLITLLFTLFSLAAFADDTAALQALLNAGAGTTVTLPVSTYYTSASLIVPASTNFQLAGSFIISSQTTGAAIKLNAGAEIQGGTVQGQWLYTTAGNPSGASGIQILGSNVTVYNMRILGYAAYGIVCAGSVASPLAANNLTITNNTITKTGYIGFYYDSEATTSTGNFSYNIVDRSMIAPSAVNELAVGIRGSSHGPGITSNWTIAHNTISMPLNPTDITAECIEIRNINNSTFSNNTLFQGSIGFSVIGTLITATSNHITNQQQENMEWYNSSACTSSHNYLSGACSQGNVLFDGYTSLLPLQHSQNISLNYDTVRSPSITAVHCYFGSKKISFNNCNFTAGTYGVDLQRSDSMTFVNTVITGSTGSSGIYFENSPGNTTINNGAITSCTYAVKAYNTNTSAIVDNIVGTDVNLTGTATQFGSYFLNGAHYGSNVRFINSSLVFNPLSPVIYGNTDFSPGAVSSLSITYTSSNHSIATIVSGNVHITGTGTDTITAANAYTSISRQLVVSKATLGIFADSFLRPYNMANPTLTATYSGFVYGEDHTVLTAQPILSTTAVTGSLPGTYTITNTGAAAANYTITNHNGTLVVAPVNVGVVIKHIYKVLNH